MTDALVIGGGPAGLAAAEVMAERGLSVTLAEAKPSLGRKFLMAGKSGLNLTRDEPAEVFKATYPSGGDWLRPMLDGFDNRAVVAWAADLGQPVFTGSTGRVFPVAMKASPLLRAWLALLDRAGVRMHTRWRWTVFSGGGFGFATPDGTQTITPKVAVLALGGGSWSRLGSDGAWTQILEPLGVDCVGFGPSNMGVVVAWSDHMKPVLGSPLKNVAITAGDTRLVGEAVISAKGLEGSLIYRFSPAIRAGYPLTLDLVPALSQAEVEDRLSRQPRKASAATALRKALRLDAAKTALLFEFAPDRSRAGLARVVKALPLPHVGPAPLDEAISTVGGVATAALDGTMLRALPGVFCAGEMVDWDAPTGGYLLTACLASGRAAGVQAADYALSGGLRRATARR